MEFEQRRTQVEKSWFAVKSIIAFYSVYLASMFPIFWLSDDDLATGTLVVSGIDALIILLYWRVSHTSLSQSLRISREAVNFSWLGLATLVPLLVVNLGYYYTLHKWLGLQPEPIIRPFESAGYPFWVVVLEVCIMPALWEEIAFRGLIQVQLEQAVRPREALVLTAVLFSVIHCSALSGAYLFLLGIVLGTLRQRSNSLIPGMLLHFFHNLMVVVVERYQLISW